MSHPKIEPSPILLAARVAKTFSLSRRLAYAQLSPDLAVISVSSNFLSFLPPDTSPNIVGLPLDQILWEFIGSEEVLQSVLTGKEPIFRISQVNRQRADGSTSYVSFYVTPLSDAQPSAGLLLMIEDETEVGKLHQTLTQDRNELRLLQRQLSSANLDLQRLNRLKSFIVSMAAHDLRSPLTTIQSYASILREDLQGQVSEQQIEFLQTILAQSERLSRLITDLLDLDQIEQGKLAITFTPVDISLLARDVLAFMRDNASIHHLRLVSDIPAEPFIIQADPERITQVLVNLISNAIKYTPENGTITVSVTRRDQFACITVEDTGNGMTESQLQQLFEIYYRTQEARQSKVVGTGLGLFIVKTLVESHDGQIEVKSTWGKGTTFRVLLPFQPVVRTTNPFIKANVL
jgi:signal transduction histidine kinase